MKSNKKLTRFHCVDCGMHTSKLGEYYMVTDEIWKMATNKAPEVMLCIGCLENRLSKIFNKEVHLTFYDFIQCPLNFAPEFMADHSDRLLNRLNNFKCQSELSRK